MTAHAAATQESNRRRPALRTRRRRHSPASLVVSFVVVGGLLLVSLIAPLIAPASPIAQNLDHRLANPSGAHLLGTDSFGRDELSRLIYGGRSAYEGVAIALGVALVVGVPWGVVAGYWPKYAGVLLMRVADAFLAFPALVLTVAVVGVLGPDLITSMVSVGVVYAPIVARLTRSGVLDVRGREYVLSARLSGCPSRVVMARHVLPAAMGAVVVQMTIFAGLAFIIEAALSFLSLGIQPPAPSWGGDLANAYQSILSNPGQIVAPGVLIAIVVLCVYRIGDEVRDRMTGTRNTAGANPTILV